jgi:ferric iron reductase protein FhuF
VNFSRSVPYVLPLDADQVARVGALSLPTSPLEATLARVAAKSARWTMRIGRPESGCLDLAGVTKRLDELMAALGSRHGTDDPSVTGTCFLKIYTRAVVGAALVSLVTERRVPDVAPGNLTIGFAPEGTVHELALAVPRFAVLPDDPAAGHPDATVLADVEALRDWLRVRLVDGHLADLMPLLQVRTRRGPRALWGTVSDMCAGVLVSLAQAEGSVEAMARSDAESHAFLSAGPPLIAGPPLRPVVHADRVAVGWQRLTCCLAYRLPDHGLCTSCPCIDSCERERRLRAELERGRQP